MKRRPTKWTEEELLKAIKTSTSIRQVLSKIGLVQAGGNYEQVKKFIRNEEIDIVHFTGKGWNKGLKIPRLPLIPMHEILIEESHFQSHKLKKRLFHEGYKLPKCEKCGWAKCSEDGRTPLELDHINGNRKDNRLENLQILCPNCHSLQPTHRGRNIKRRGGGTGIRATLKMS